VIFFSGVYHALDEYLHDARPPQASLLKDEGPPPPTHTAAEVPQQTKKTFSKCVERPAASTDGDVLDDECTVAAALNDDVEWNAMIDCLFPDFYDLRSNCDTCSLDRDGSYNTRVFHGDLFDENMYNWKKDILYRFLKDL
jgi:hypothetical protein